MRGFQGDSICIKAEEKFLNFSFPVFWEGKVFSFPVFWEGKVYLTVLPFYAYLYLVALIRLSKLHTTTIDKHNWKA
jgi:hypothetical protein